MALKVGDKAPEFKLKDSFEKEVSLSDFQGKRIILYFYPKDNTPGCTKEACNFKENWNLLQFFHRWPSQPVQAMLLEYL